MAFETIKIPSASVGNQAHIHLHRFGPKGVKGVKKFIFKWVCMRMNTLGYWSLSICLGILDFLAHEHLIERIPSPKKPFALKPGRVDQVRILKATASGIITYRSKLGEILKAGEAVADLVLVDHPKAKSVSALAPCNGYLFSQTGQFFITKGDRVAMLSTQEQHSQAGTQLAF